MKILLSNDDGYSAVGLAALADAVAPLADTVIVAPDRNQSGSSHSLTLDAPLRVGNAGNNVYFVNGTPTHGYRKKNKGYIIIKKCNF